MRFLLLSLVLLVIPIASASVRVSEVMADPTQDENYNEWIELYNQGPEDVNLSEYSLCGDVLLSGYMKHVEGKSEGELTGDAGLIFKSGQYALVTDGGSGTEAYSNFNVNSGALALHVGKSLLCGRLSNSGKEIMLEKSGAAEDSFVYPAAKTGKTFIRSGGAIVLADPTPGAENPTPQQDDEESQKNDEQSSGGEQGQQQDGEVQSQAQINQDAQTENNSEQSPLSDKIIVEIISAPSSAAAGEEITVRARLTNTYAEAKTVSVYSYAYEKKNLKSEGWNGKSWEADWDANVQELALGTGQSAEVELRNRVKTIILTGDYSLKVRAKLGEKAYDASYGISVISAAGMEGQASSSEDQSAELEDSGPPEGGNEESLVKSPAVGEQITSKTIYVGQNRAGVRLPALIFIGILVAIIVVLVVGVVR